MRFATVFFLLGIAFVALTNRYWVDDPDMSVYRFDSVSYLEIARAFPEFPKAIDVSRGYPDDPHAREAVIPYHHAQRFAGAWVIGGVAKLFGIGVAPVFFAVTVAAIAGILALVWDLLESYGLNLSYRYLLLGVLFFNPNFTRFYVAVPTYIGDVLFMLGLCWVLRALIRIRSAELVLGISLSALGRQTAVLLFPTILFWTLLHPNWKSVGPKRGLSVLAALFSGLLIYWSSGQIAARMNPHSINLEHVLGLWRWWREAHDGVDPSLTLGVPLVPRSVIQQPSSWLALLAFCLRGLAPFLLPFLILLGLPRRGDLSGERKLERGLLLFLTASIAAQPFLGGPVLTGATIGRLVALGLPAAVLACGASFTQLTKQEMSESRFAFAMLGFAMISFHHRTTWIHGGLDDAPYFMTVYLLGSILVFWQLRRALVGQRPHPAVCGEP